MNTYSKSAASTTVVPTAHIATHNNRQKQYNPTSKEPIYYLNNNDEFQIELYNPTMYVVRCDIWLNGSIIPGGGLVLRPAERVFLDRYLNSPKKFAFETYKVGNTDSDKQAIANNGSVQVKFYKETISRNLYTTGTTYTPTYIPYISTNTPYYNYNTITTANIGVTGNTGIKGNSGTSGTSGCAAPGGYASTTNFIDTTSLNNPNWITTLTTNNNLLTDSPDPIKQTQIKGKLSKKIETGRVGEGSNSNQKFTNVHYEFEYSPFHTVSYKLLPHSVKPQTLNTLNKVRYCTDCGSKLKPNYKFCANCGTKI